MITGMHPVPMLGLPPVNYHYAKAIGRGRPVGKPVHLTVAQADAVVQKELHHKFVIPYIPIFHDCRTYVCSVAAKRPGEVVAPLLSSLQGLLVAAFAFPDQI